ncbi:MAG TPA: tetratricopeptide repeat protein, partial [Pyrinomonadaceae bacterium]|nr:tetratricopeptide repeat protein [Pyrinomonadaceae bacterium]
MHKPTQKILAALVLMIPCISLMAQQPSNVFAKIEKSIRENEPNWTLMQIDGWSNPTGQASVMYRWRLDQREIFIIVNRERSTAEAVKFFQDRMAQASLETVPLKLNIGDGSYLRKIGRHTAVVIRKNNIVVHVSSDSEGPDLLRRFAGHIDSAFEQLDDSAKRGATDHRKKAEDALASGRNEEAIEEFKQALSLEGDSVESHHGLGLAYLQVGDKTNARNSFKEAVRLKPDWPQAHFDLGQTYYELGEYATAANSFEEAVRLKPDFFEALLSLGKTYEHANEHAKAVEVLQKAVLLQPDNIDARNFLGTALILTGQPQDAVTVLQEAARLSPQSALIQANLGRAYKLTGKFQESLTALLQS